MKKLKLITAIVAMSVCLNLVFAGKPLKETKENLAKMLIEKLGKDVQLTDSQKIVLNEYAKTFITKMESTDSIPNNETKFKSKEQASLEYQTLLDNLLTNSQKEQRKIKIKDREKGNNK